MALILWYCVLRVVHINDALKDNSLTHCTRSAQRKTKSRAVKTREARKAVNRRQQHSATTRNMSTQHQSTTLGCTKGRNFDALCTPENTVWDSRKSKWSALMCRLRPLHDRCGRLRITFNKQWAPYQRINGTFDWFLPRSRLGLQQCGAKHSQDHNQIKKPALSRMFSCSQYNQRSHVDGMQWDLGWAASLKKWECLRALWAGAHYSQWSRWI